MLTDGNAISASAPDTGEVGLKHNQPNVRK
jgi:hypothetical protein